MNQKSFASRRRGAMERTYELPEWTHSGTETPTVDSFRKAAKESDRRALLLVYRDGVTIFMSLSG